MNKLVSYTYDFVSYLMLQPDLNKFNIERIILFGSVARYDYDEKSDVDIFIDTKNKKIDGLRKIVDKIKSDFFNSERFDKWRLLNMKNEFSIIVSNLQDDKWKDLRRSMHSHGIVLYDRYLEGKKEDLRAYSLIKWEIGSKENNKRVNLARKFYGYKQKGKEYTGVLVDMDATLIGDSVVIIPSQHTNRIRHILNTLKIKYKIKDIYY